MNPEYDPSATMEVIYDGKLTLESSYEVEILIVKHLDLNCLEIFAFDFNLHKESNRLYVNSKKVRSKLNRKDIEERSSSLQFEDVGQEAYLDHLNQITSDLSVEYVLNRIHLDSEALSSSRCVLFLSSTERGTVDPTKASLASNEVPVFQYVVKPEGVVPFVLNRSSEGSAHGDDEDPDSSADEFNAEEHGKVQHARSPNGDSAKTKLQSLAQKKSFSCCNDINILWEEKEETEVVLSISELISQSNNTAEISGSNSSGTKSRSNSKPHIEPAPRRSSFDSVVHNLASRVLAPLFPESSSSSSSGSGVSGSSSGDGRNTLDAGITPKRRSTFSIFQTATRAPKPMHGENYKASMKLAPLERVPSTPTTPSAAGSGGENGKTPKSVASSVIALTPPRIFGSSSTISNSRSGSETTMDNNYLPGLSPSSTKGSPLTPVVGRKTISKKKLSHHHITSYL